MKCKPPFILLLCIVILLELLSALLAFQTLGEVFRTLYFAAVVLNAIFIVLAFRYPNTALIGILALALLIVPYQFWLTSRLWCLQNEAAAIVTYAYEEKLQSGEYPTSLDNFHFEDEAIARHFHYQTGLSECEFFVSYYVGTPTTSHEYCAPQGWSYYPD